MSANNAIFIKHSTFEVFYQGCYDNWLDNADLIGKGKDLEGAYKIAKEYRDDMNDEGMGWYIEYGIQIID